MPASPARLRSPMTGLVWRGSSWEGSNDQHPLWFREHSTKGEYPILDVERRGSEIHHQQRVGSRIDPASEMKSQGTPIPCAKLAEKDALLDSFSDAFKCLGHAAAATSLGDVVGDEHPSSRCRINGSPSGDDHLDPLQSTWRCRGPDGA